MKIDNEILSIINDIPWFENCGNRTEISLNYKYKFVTEKEMIRSLSGTKWENLELDEFNKLYDWFRTSSICLAWNRSVDEIKKDEMPKFDLLVKDKIKKIFGNEQKLVLDSFHWDLLMIIMKLTISKRFSSNDEPYFYNELLEIYKSGHFPCGWRGHYPEGTVLIY